MDRRKRKTREAIFSAFTSLLEEKPLDRITVGEIIARADVGRATFYAHFETKEFLVKAFCEELFCHIFDALDGNAQGHAHIFACDAHESVFLHLFRHLEKNDHQILSLLSCRNNELFLQYFKSGIVRLVESREKILNMHEERELPRAFWINHVSSAFVETVRFWVSNKRKETPEEIAAYFLQAIG